VLSAKRPYLDGTLTDPTGQWTGRAPAVFYSASVIWGAVAPARFFTGNYVWLYGGFVLGAIVPVGCWFAHRRWPGRKFNKVGASGASRWSTMEVLVERTRQGVTEG
jgi:hypothetical protein